MARRINQRQRDASDCGPACISSITAHYRRPVPVSIIRQLARTDQAGTSMYGMLKALGELGYEARGLRGQADQLGTLPAPFIAHCALPGGLLHYVVVYRISKRGYRVMDPAFGRIEMIAPGKFRELWTGSLIALVPGTASGFVNPDSPLRDRFLSLLRPLWKPILQAFFAAILYTLLGLSSSIYLGKLTDHVYVTRNTGLLNLMSLAMILITLVMTLLVTHRNLIMLKTGQVIDNQLILSYCRHLFRLPERFFDSMSHGEILSRIGDAVKIRGFINETAVGILVNFLILAFSFTAMLVVHPPLGFILLAAVPLYAVIYILFNRLNRKIERRVMEQSAVLEAQLVDTLRAETQIRQFNLRDHVHHGTEVKLNRLLDRLYRSGINAIAASSATELMNRALTIILLWTGSFIVLRGGITPGNLLTIYALMGYCTGPLASLIGANKAYQNAMIAADRLFETFLIGPEQKPGKRAMKKAHFGTVELKGICFSYGSRGQQVSDLDLVIPDGKITALTGPSGSGKSTVARLIQQQYPPDRGRITINKMDIRNYSLESIRSMIGAVPQGISILPGTLLENLVPGVRDPDMHRLFELIGLLGLRPLVESLPSGLDTGIGENGLHLSGGELQRLGMIRALYPDPPLLVLDEPGTFLDKESQQTVDRLLLQLKQAGQTILMATHNPGFVSLADQVCRMEAGTIVSRTGAPGP